jgi:hypothetical protein
MDTSNLYNHEVALFDTNVRPVAHCSPWMHSRTTGRQNTDDTDDPDRTTMYD